MVSHSAVTHRILGEVKRMHGCDLDTLAESLPEFSWNQVFLEIDRLSRQGQVLVTFGSGGRYMIRLPASKTERATHHTRT